MKKFLFNILKFIIIFLSLFFAIFIGIVLFHASNEIRLGEFSHNSLIQVFLLALFSSCFISIVIFNGFCLSDVTTYRLLTQLIPVVVTTLFVGVTLIFVKKQTVSSEMILSADARIYFTPNSFNTYKDVIDNTFEINDFEQNILKKIEDDKTRNYFKSKFTHSSSGYTLKPRTLYYDYDKLLDILYGIGYYTDTKYHFEGIGKDSIASAIITKNGESAFYKNLSVSFYDKYIYVTSDDYNLCLVFDRSKQINTNFNHTFLSDTILNAIKYFPFYFIESDSVICCILIWLSFSLFLVSVFSIVWFKSFKFISLIIQTVIAGGIYVLMPQIMSFNQIIAKLPISNEIFRGMLFASVLILISVIILLINIFGLKSGVWEQD